MARADRLSLDAIDMDVRFLLLLLSACSYVSSVLCEDAARFVAPRHVATQELAHLRPAGMGKCWMITGHCRSWKQYAGFVDEPADVYLSKKVGEKEEACLARAQANWQLCKNMKTQQVSMLFLPSGAMSSYPPDDVVDQAHERVRNSLAIVYTGVFGAGSDGESYDPLPTVVSQSVHTSFLLFSDHDFSSPHKYRSRQDASKANIARHVDQVDSWVPLEPAASLGSAKQTENWHKVFPDKIPALGSADYIIWVDGNISLLFVCAQAHVRAHEFISVSDVTGVCA